MKPSLSPSQSLAARITRNASKQTYYTIRLLVDRKMVADAYRAYAYFRWVDDVQDAPGASCTEKQAFLERQAALLEACYQGPPSMQVSSEEQMLVELVGNNREADSGLQTYLRWMMEVMRFDTRRCGSPVSQVELSEYTRNLAVAVSAALCYFIGHQTGGAAQQEWIMAVSAAHIIHMLRDTQEDLRAGYFNIPAEVILQNGLDMQDLDWSALRAWVQSRVELAHHYFKAGRQGIGRERCLRRCLAGYAYVARFEWMIKIIRKDGYRLQTDYSRRRSPQAGLWMAWRLLGSLVVLPRQKGEENSLERHSLRVNGR